MNPLQWKREHRLALAIAIGLGAAIAAITAFAVLNPADYRGTLALYCEWQDRYCTYFRAGYWFVALIWATLGAAAAGTLVYIRQLLR